MDINTGDRIEIEHNTYDVLHVTEDIDQFDTQKNKVFGEHRAIELHKINDPSLHPTHLLKIYHDKPEQGTLLCIEQERLPKEIAQPKQRGMMFSYHDGKIISLKNITHETKHPGNSN